MRTLFPVLLTVLLLGSAGIYAQENKPPPGEDYVSRAEYDKLKAEHEAMKQELEGLKTTVRQIANGTVPAPAEGPSTTTKSPEGKQVVTEATSQSDLDALHEEVDSLKSEIKGVVPGTTKFLLAGYSTAGFTARSGEDPFFDAAFNAIFLWKVNDRLLFEGELEFQF
jgi:hypothetical protein